MDNRIKSERVLANLTQEQLAVIIEVHPNTIGKWEKDISDCPARKLRAMADRFGCSVDYLLGNTETRC